jgi:fimbrial chaperone protein
MRVRILNRLIGPAAAIALLITASLVAAARISPMVVDLQPIGRASIGRVEVANPGDSEFPLEVQMFRGQIGERGELSLTPADDQFLVFPAQAVMPPRSQQVFRVQYVGNPTLATSEIYYMSVRQIPVDLQAGTPQVQIVVNFNVLVNVIPEGSTAEPVIDTVRVVTRDNVPGIEVRVTNRGTRYFAASRANWAISGTRADGSDGSFRRNRSEMSRAIGVGVVPPGGARVFFVPTEAPMAEGTVRVALET